jgi:hypothetical protein
MAKKIILDSRYGSGPAYNKTFALPKSSVVCRRASEHVEIACHAFSASYTWNSVNASNNTFTLTGTGAPVVVELGIGNYTFEELTCTITAALVDAGLASASVTYLRPYNKLHFQLPEVMALTFNNASYKVLGFAATDAPSGTSFTSTTAIDLSPIDSVWVRMEGVSMMGDGCLANWMGEVKPAPVLFTLPIMPSPFQKLNYTAPADGTFAVSLSDREVRTITLVMCDGTGAPLVDFPDYTITLRAHVVDRHLANMDETLSAILQHVRVAAENYDAEFQARYMQEALEYLATKEENEHHAPEA